MLDKVAKMWTEAGVNIPNEVIDRAYRTGPSYTHKNTNAQCKSVKVRTSQYNGLSNKRESGTRCENKTRSNEK